MCLHISIGLHVLGEVPFQMEKTERIILQATHDMHITLVYIIITLELHIFKLMNVEVGPT